MEAIVTNSLSRSFGQRKAVNNVSLTVHEGEFFSLLGVNGAGKTTLIRMLCCLCAPTSGSAQVLGQDIVHQAAQVKSMRWQISAPRRFRAAGCAVFPSPWRW